MFKFILLLFVFIVLMHHVDSQRTGSGTGSAGKSTYGYKSYNRGGRFPMNGYSGYSAEKGGTHSKGSGISAWGIVAIVLSVIAIGVGFHYILFCYPVMCKRERKYNTMEMNPV